MIAIQKANGAYRPVVVCDHCGTVIEDAMTAMEISSSAPEGATAQAFHVHKGICDETLTDKLGGLHGSEELSVHLFQLIQNTFRTSDRRRLRSFLDSLDDAD